MIENAFENIGEQIGDLQLGTKKKRTKKEVQNIQSVVPLNIGIGSQNLIDSNKESPDYTYEEALNLMYKKLKENNPDFGSDRRALVMKPPVIEKCGSRKTSFSNFFEICHYMRRDSKHVFQFIISELGTTGSLNKSNCLIVVGKFQNQHFERVLRSYIREYILCHTCKSPDTYLTKETRICYLKCNNCGSQCAVAALRSGFKAVVGRRSA